MSSRKRKRSSVSKRHKPDSTILIFCIVMAIFGAIMIFDASVYIANKEPFNNQFHFLNQQLVWLLFGSAIGFLAYIIDYKKILKYSFPILLFIILLLVLVLIFGKEVNGAKRWFSLGQIPQIQPAEFAKLAIILYLSSWLSKREYSFNTLKEAFKKGFLRNFSSLIAILGIVILLILLQPDLGTVLIIFATGFLMFFGSGKDNAHTLGSLAVALLAIPVFLITIIIEPYRLERAKTYIDLVLKGKVTDPRGTGYQIQQILIGIGSGGFWGKGFGQSRQRFGYLVEVTAFTDSTFAIVLEELGFWGGSLLVMAWIFFLWRGFRIFEKIQEKEGQLLALGIVIWLTTQAFLNMASNVGIIPLTGIPLPFLSYGGSSTIVTLIAFGLLLNVSSYTEV